MAGIFLSYRREDAAGWAGRLSADLAAGFRRVNIFMDIDAIPPGVNFDEYIAQAVGSCDVLIALIGPHWLTIADKSGKRRLDDPEDFTRIEIATALKRNIRVIPALVGGATVPAAEDLPEDLKPLARRQAYQLADHRWNDDCKRLIAVLKPIVQTNGRIIHKVLGALGLALVLSLAGYGGKLWHDHYVKSKEEQEKVIQEKVAAEKKRLVDARKKAEGAYNAALNWQKRADEYAREANGYAQEAEASAKATIVSFPSRASSESAKSAVDSARQNAVAAREAAVRAEGAAKAAREAVVTVKTKAEEVVRATEPAVATLAANAAVVAEGMVKTAADNASKETGSAKDAAAAAFQAKDQVLAIVDKEKAHIAKEDQKQIAQAAADKQRLLEARKKADAAYNAALSWQNRTDQYAQEAERSAAQAVEAYRAAQVKFPSQAAFESAKSAREAVQSNYDAAKRAMIRAESAKKTAGQAVVTARNKADEAAKATDPAVAVSAASEAARAESAAKDAAENARKEAGAVKDAATAVSWARDQVFAILRDSAPALPPPRPSRNEIRNFRAENISDSQLRVTVDYTYVGDKGKGERGRIEIQACSEQPDGRLTPGTRCIFAPMVVGDSSATMLIDNRDDRRDYRVTGTYQSSSVRVCMWSWETSPARSGSWFSAPNGSRLSFRLWDSPNHRDDFTGFRLVQAPRMPEPTRPRPEPFYCETFGHVKVWHR